MNVILRKAGPADAPALLRIKEALRMPTPPAEAASAATVPVVREGFLLGSTLTQYEDFLAHDDVDVLLLEDREAGAPFGFAIVLAEAALKRSGLWERAQSASWEASALSSLNPAAGFAYFEQLAVLPGSAHRVYAKYLAYLAVHRAFATHGGIFTTVIRYPVHNRAALPLIEVVGFRHLAELEEHPPGYGRIVSDIYYLDREVLRQREQRPDFQHFLRRMQRLAIE